MANGGGGESKTEKATPRRRQKLREEGNVPKSPELNSALIILFGFGILYFSFYYFWNEILIGSFKEIEVFMSPYHLHKEDITLFWNEGLKKTLIWVALILILTLVVAVISNIIQFGFLFTLKPLKPRLDKFNIIQGLKNLFFSLNALFETVKNIVKLTLISAVSAYFIYSHFEEILSLFKLPLLQGVSLLALIIVKLSAIIVALGLALAIIDYAYRRWKYEKDIMMTRWEVKEEFKETEGHPEIKKAIRKKMREIIARRMLQQVPSATVVITNPTHYAVALKYDIEKDRAPKVVAKGVDYLAKKIIEIAKQHGVEIYREPALARALYYSVEVGQEIPEEFYRAVAKIIAYVYRKTGKKI